MSLMRSLGRISGKVGCNKEFMSGMMEGMDPRIVAEVINDNTGFLVKMYDHLDPKAMADAMNEGMAFMGESMKYLDPKAIGEVINMNERILPRFVECINPNVFTRSAGTVFTKLRFATYRPPMFQKAGVGEQAEE